MCFDVILDFFAICVITILFYLMQPIELSRIINVPKGSLSSIISYLNDTYPNRAHFNKLDMLFIKTLGHAQSGFIDVKSEVLPKGAFFKALVSSKAATMDVTLIPGETMHFFFIILSEALHLNIEALESAYNELFELPDGMIFPDTYALPIGIDEMGVMKLLHDISMRRHERESVRLLGHYDKDEWFKIISTASIVQKEAANVSEMPLVAAVVFNRLKIDMALQMDGSLNYGAFSHSKVTPERIRNDESPYNTYKHKGIPPLPAGSASIAAIEAVLNPASVDYLYFVRDRATGVHKFSKTYKEHRSNF